MSPTWQSGDLPVPTKITADGWLRVVAKALALGSVLVTGLVVLLILRLVERPFFGTARPWSPYVTQTVCRIALGLIALRYKATGQPMAQAGAQVANHGSWLDILVLNAGDRVYFVSKSEVSDWPGIGWLARATGTLFISRRAQEAGSQKTAFEDRLQAGHRLLFFPEGTSTDAQRILPFKSSLFAAFFAEGLEDDMHIQPVTVSYKAPDGVDPRFYGWWGDMGFGDHALRLLAARRQGSVEVTYHAPLAVADATDRKALAKSAEEAVKSVFPKLPSVS